MGYLSTINVNGIVYDLRDEAAARAANTYTKGEVDAIVAAIKQFTPIVAPMRPTASADTMYKLYLVPSEDPQESNVKDEYITIDNGASANPRYTWEKIGSTDIDISGKADIDTVPKDVTRTASDVTFVNSDNEPLFYLRQASSSLAGVMRAEEHTKLGALPTNDELTSALGGKQDTISDIATIRSGASAGATAYQKPSGGIPASDMAQTVQTSLGKAETAAQQATAAQHAADAAVEAVDGMQEELDNKANKDGFYVTLGAGTAVNLAGNTIVNAEFYKRKTGGTQSVGSGIAAIKEVRGKSIVWNQKVNLSSYKKINSTTFSLNNDICEIETTEAGQWSFYRVFEKSIVPQGHKILCIARIKSFEEDFVFMYSLLGRDIKTVAVTKNAWSMVSEIITSNGVEKYNRYAIENVAHFYLQDMFFDLTLMFGAGNEPTTVEEFEAMFPLDYYDYNAGEVIPFAGQNLVTIGKNQYNPTSGKANLLGGQTYQLLGTYTGATIDGVAVTLDSNNCFTTTEDCVLEITGGNDTDTIVALYNGENVTYEPYEKHTLPLDPSQWRDKDGNLVFPYGGMHGVGNAYDYAKVDADGYIRKAVRCFRQVDMGTLTGWTWNEYFDLPFKNKPDDAPLRYKAIIDKYQYMGNISPGYVGNMQASCAFNGDRLYINDSAISRDDIVNGQIAKLNGVKLCYELAEPVEVELATPIYAKYLVDKDGTEEITPANGTKPYTTMANLSILYAMDARGAIQNLPKNYLSKESAENMLNAMVAAGIIASYTMTYDAANGRYAFTFVKASANNEQA